MMTTLLLTPAEQKTFAALPEPLRNGWTVETESGTAYETDYELMIRANMAELTGFPAFKTMSEAIRAGKQVDPASLGVIPEEVIPEILFSIGARGISVLIDTLLSRTSKDEDVQAIAAFGQFRKDILESNVLAKSASR